MAWIDDQHKKNMERLINQGNEQEFIDYVWCMIEQTNFAIEQRKKRGEKPQKD